MAQFVSRSREIVNQKGIVPLLRSAKKFGKETIKDQWLKYRYRMEYGEIAPRPDERRWVDPNELDYSIQESRLYGEDRNYPRYGVLGGSWDRHKNPWRESPVWWGLVERFDQGKPWHETGYYEWAVDRLDAGEIVGPMDGPQTRENLERHFDYLDDLYADIKHNGYEPSSTITAHVGRNGEWIVGHGNHRRTIASIIGIDAVPIRVKYRHREWQAVRRRFHEADSVAEVRDLEEHFSHPDTPDIQ